jgi:hypothetical protein
MSQHTAPHMRWHAKGRTKDGVSRHSVDGQAWQLFAHMRWHAKRRTKDGVLRHPVDGQAWQLFDNL